VAQIARKLSFQNEYLTLTR